MPWTSGSVDSDSCFIAKCARSSFILISGSIIFQREHPAYRSD